MITLLRIIIWSIIFYVVYRLAVSVMKIFTDTKREEREKVKAEQKSKFNIDKKDIIEASFEELNTGDKEKSKDKQ